MLTRDDRTVEDAVTVCVGLAGVGLERIGFKDAGLPAATLGDLVGAVHALGCEAVLELVSLRQRDEARWSERAAATGVDLLLGGAHAATVSAALAGTRVRYFPFAGRVTGHPTRLAGGVNQIATDACRLSGLAHVHGIDLLAYRSNADAPVLARAVVDAVELPVVVVGGISSETQISRLTAAGVWGFTMGTAVFDGTFRSEAASLRDRIAGALRAARRADVALQM